MRPLIRRTPAGVPYATPTAVPRTPPYADTEPAPQPASDQDTGPEPAPAHSPDRPTKRQPKLTEDDVRAIRRDYAAGKFGVGHLAYIYGVAQPTMSAVVHGRTWRHVTDQPTEGN